MAFKAIFTIESGPRSACRRSCAEHSECSYWTWGKGTPTGPCYLKTSRDGVTHGMTDYVSGSKGCLLPEDKGQQEDDDLA